MKGQLVPKGEGQVDEMGIFDDSCTVLTLPDAPPPSSQLCIFFIILSDRSLANLCNFEITAPTVSREIALPPSKKRKRKQDNKRGEEEGGLFPALSNYGSEPQQLKDAKNHGDNGHERPTQYREKLIQDIIKKS